MSFQTTIISILFTIIDIQIINVSIVSQSENTFIILSIKSLKMVRFKSKSYFIVKIKYRSLSFYIVLMLACELESVDRCTAQDLEMKFLIYCYTDTFRNHFMLEVYNNNRIRYFIIRPRANTLIIYFLLYVQV